MSPFNSFLILQGIETLPLRMERHSQNANAVARFLTEHPKVTWVNYPGLAGHPSYDVATKYWKHGHFGAILGFGIKGGRAAGRRFIETLRVFSHLANVGDAKSLVIHPATTTHYRMSDADLRKSGITAGTVRLSIGLEDPQDLIDDLDRAIKISQK
jgi:O-acetylhomoserine (thiol)-lyase